MSTTPESEFDLEKLFLPSWAQDTPGVNRYANFAGEDRHDRKFDDRNRSRPPRRDLPRGNGPRKDGPRRPGSAPRDQGRPEPRRDVAPPLPLPEIIVSLLPDEKGVESLARQIRMAGRAYPLFDIARLILQKPERQQVRFEVIKGPDGKVVQPLFLCALDDSLWLSEDEVVQHVLGKHFATFYQAERTATEPPKGIYTFVAQCGMSGTILGPPNLHDYQTQLRKLHAERFARMPFDAFKARVKIVKDETIVKKWIEDHSFKTEYICLNVPESQKLPSREEVEKHFRQVHLPNLIKSVESHVVSGVAARQLRSPSLQRALREAVEEQRRFPLRLATVLSQQFASHGLQFFKVNKTVTHVSVARPRFLDMEATPVSEGVKRIVEFINSNSKCTRRKLFAALAPTAAPAPIAASTPVASAQTTPAAAAPAPESTPEQTALASDLHWLVHEGHVIEFANGVLETAKKPLPRPPKPEKKQAPATESAAPSVTPPADLPDLSSEGQETEQAPVAASNEVAAVQPPATDASASQPAMPSGEPDTAAGVIK